jgi:hypothetical protein
VVHCSIIIYRFFLGTGHRIDGWDRAFKGDSFNVNVSSQATDGARRAVGTHHGPTRIHLADYSLRHRRDGNAGTTILYHLRNRRRPHSSSGMTAGRRELLEDGHRRRFRRGRRTFRGTTGRDGAAGGLSRSTPRRADDTTTRPSGAGRRVSPTTRTRSQTTCYVRRGTGRVVHC